MPLMIGATQLLAMLRGTRAGIVPARHMNIYFARAEGKGASAHSAVPELSRKLLSQREPKPHREVNDPSDADVVLFVDCHMHPKDWRLHGLTSSLVARQYPHKVAVYDERDMPWCRFPGIYVSMPSSSFVPRWQVPGSYWHVESLPLRLGNNPASVEPDLLFSFVGTRTHSCRDAILALPVTRAHIEEVRGFMFWDSSSAHFEERRRKFAEITLRSKFVLCPRGHGTASIRLFEVLSAGRVPVIVADEWVPPRGPKWDDFAIRWPSSKISELPSMLQQIEHQAASMGALALDAYDSWFASDIAITRQLDQLKALVQVTDRSQFPRFGYRNAQYLRCNARVVAGRLRGIRKRTSPEH